MPGAIAPVERRVAKGTVVLARARGATRAQLGHVDLLDRVELGCRVHGQHARQARREPRAQHDVQAPLARLRIELEQ